MIHFDLISIFPEMFSSILEQGIVAKALKNNLFSLDLHQLRNFSKHRNRNIDDSSYGGGGQVMMIEPLVNAVLYCKEQYIINKKEEIYSNNNNLSSTIIYMSPQGKRLNQPIVNQLAKQSHIIVVCGRYEGVDERFIEHYVDLEISVGDFVVSGGELPSMLLIDAIARQQPDVMKDCSVKQDSFMNNLLDFPHYTKPIDYNGHKVPEILLSGNHAQIQKWREQKAIAATLLKRPDLILQD
jgi:tRNA (guanine37-N1)-methyltransferase